MSLFQTIGDQLKEAMKSGDTARRDTLRLLQSAVKNAAIDKRKPAAEFSDEEIVEVIRRMVKQRKDSIEQYRAGGREDLAAQEQAELELLSGYLPASMPEAELRAIVEETIKETGATSKGDMGKVMGAAMKKVTGRATGDEVRAVVESLLS